MQKKLYKLNVIKEFIPAGEYGYTGRNNQGLYFSHDGGNVRNKETMKSSEVPAPTEIYINLYDIASIEERKLLKSTDYYNIFEEYTDGYILKMSTGIYLIPVEDGKKIIELLGCIN